MAVTQVSVFLENRPGSLNEVISLLGQAGVNIRALSLADTARYGILRLMVNDVKKAVRTLGKANIAATTTPVLAVEVPDRPGGLARIVAACADAGLNIEYLYAFVEKKARERAVVVLRFEDVRNAERVLEKLGVRQLTEQDIAAL